MANSFFTYIYDQILYYKLYDLIIINSVRERTYFETFDEVIIPVIFYLFSKNKERKNERFFLLFSFVLLTIVVVFSGWRIRLLMLIFGSIMSIIFFKKKFTTYYFSPFIQSL